MTHDDYRELIQRELDDDLSSGELATLEAHLSTCADCRREREEYKSIASGLARLSKVMPERSFVSQITPEMLQPPQQLPPKQSVLRRITPNWYRGLSVAAVVLLAVGFSTQWQFGLSNGHLSGTQVAQGPDKAQTTLPAVQDATHPASDANSSVAPSTPADQQRVAVNTPSSSSTTTSNAGTSAAATQSTSSATNEATSPIVVPKSTDSVRVADATSAAEKTHKPASGVGNGTPAPNKTLTGGNGAITPSTHDADPTGGVVSITTGGHYGTSALQTITIGATPILPDLFNTQLQQEVNNGQASANWATDSYQVVQRSLTTLGFSANATLMSTDDVSRVHVLQGGVLYEIQLEQPFDNGAKGIWRPTRIGRGINEVSPVGYEQAILDYFNAQITSGAIDGRQEVFVVRSFDHNTISVTVNEQRNITGDEHKWDHVQYDLTLDQDTTGKWSVKNAMIVNATK
ncbi:MAG: anti-sigma factor family protein [Tumebacillaceae bacterium]